MRRIVLASFLLLLAACTTVGALLGNDMRFSQPQLQSYLDRAFPRDYDKLGGLVTLRVMHPRLTIPQGSDQLRMDFDLGIGGLGMASDAVAGRFSLRSGLRFDPKTRGLHLDNPALVDVDVPVLGGRMGDTTRQALNTWLADYARQEPVYRLDDNAWGRMANRRIGETTIDAGGVTLHLDP